MADNRAPVGCCIPLLQPHGSTDEVQRGGNGLQGKDQETAGVHYSVSPSLHDDATTVTMTIHCHVSSLLLVVVRGGLKCGNRVASWVHKYIHIQKIQMQLFFINQYVNCCTHITDNALYSTA